MKDRVLKSKAPSKVLKGSSHDFESYSPEKVLSLYRVLKDLMEDFDPFKGEVSKAEEELLLQLGLSYEDPFTLTSELLSLSTFLEAEVNKRNSKL